MRGRSKEGKGQKLGRGGMERSKAREEGSRGEVKRGGGFKSYGGEGSRGEGQRLGRGGQKLGWGGIGGGEQRKSIKVRD